MKKFLALLMAAVMLAVVPAAFAEDTVFVTICNGELVLPLCEVALTDADGDGALTINDALINAHDTAYEGGADAGYGASMSEYGLGMTILWGVENGGSYGYYVNDASAWSLTDPVKAGDHITAFVYTDLTTWSDTYSYFDTIAAVGEAGEQLTLTLNAVTFDENYAPVVVTVAGADITVNGETVVGQTDENGQITLDVTEAGTYVVSAVANDAVLVPPVCVIVAE